MIKNTVGPAPPTLGNLDNESAPPPYSVCPPITEPASTWSADPPLQANTFPPHPIQPPPSEPPPHQAETAGSNTVVVTQPVSQGYGPHPQGTTCPFCARRITTYTTLEISHRTWWWFFTLCIFGCWLCCWIPFCCDSCHDVTHTCPECQRDIGYYVR